MSLLTMLPAMLRDCFRGTPDWRAITAGVPGAAVGLAIAFGSGPLARVLVPDAGEVPSARSEFSSEFNELGSHYAAISAASWSSFGGGDDRDGFLAAIPGSWFLAAVLALIAALVSGLIVHRFGLTVRAIEVAVFCVALLLLAAIDARHHLLPDLLTLALMWAGLIVNLHHGFVMTAGAVWGAVAGYAFLRVLVLPAHLLGREVIGFGDFKLCAAIGAWLGIAALPQVFALSGIAATIGMGIVRATGREGDDGLQALGPYIVAAGVATMLGGVWLDIPFLNVQLSI